MNELLLKEIIGAQGPLSGASIETISRVSGGCIHDAWRLELTDGRLLFAKTGPADAFPLLHFEAQGLKELRRFSNSSLIQVPKPIAIKQFANSAILLLPWLDLNGNNQRSLGAGLAELHKWSAKESPGKFGWDIDGFIGTSPQICGWDKNWGECFVELRLKPQIQSASQWGLEITHLKSFLSSIISFLNSHEPMPCLVHGDLWSGNAAVQNDGIGVLIDPATWWADREVDLAMTKLFGGFSNDFYSAYEAAWPLPNSSKQRIEVYNLYHLLNHANLFGGIYQTQCMTNIKKLKESIIPSAPMD